MPADPFEAELLAMAGALVDKDKSGVPEMSDDDSDDSVDEDRTSGWGDYDGAQDDASNSMQAQNAPDLECDIKAGERDLQFFKFDIF